MMFTDTRHALDKSNSIRSRSSFIDR